MIDHTGINVSDLPRALAFYERALAPLGYRVKLRIGEAAAGLGADRDGRPGADPGGDFWLSQGTPQSPRVHVAFRAGSHEEVRAFHAAALAAGGQDNGPPGYRPHYHAHYFAAFVLDPEGYNVEAVCHLAVDAG